MATHPIAEVAKQPAQQTAKQAAKFRLFGRNEEGMMFGDAARFCAEALGLEAALGQTRDRDDYLRLSLAQAEGLREKLEQAGYDLLIIQPKNAAIGIGKNTASLIGDGAIVVGQALGIPLGQTQKSERPLVRFPKEQVEQVVELLKAEGFKVKVEEIPSNNPPQAWFREDENSDRFYLFDASAKNVSEALEIPLAQTPGGRPKLEMSREQFKAAKKRLKELGFEVVQKDLELKAKLLASDPTLQSGVFVGNDALEVAALLDKPLRKTAPTVKTGAPLPMVVLMAQSEIEAAMRVLQENGYRVEVQYRSESKVANITLYKSGGIFFGEAALEVADALELEIERVSSGNAMVKVPMVRMDDARSIVEANGYRLNETYRREQSDEKQSKTTNIVLTGKQLILFRQAAELLAQTWKMDTEHQGNQVILKLPIDLLTKVEAVLLENKFEIERREIVAAGR
jgi:hypothetical protein